MKNAYVEITNICNLSCDFCPGHDREPKFMKTDEFELIAKKLTGRIENLFLHIMGEPLLHPDLERIIMIADGMKVKLKLTTNGTHIISKLPILLASKSLHTVSISLHSFEGNNSGAMAEKKLDLYLSNCFSAAAQLAKAGKFVVLRLWNLTEEEKNAKNSLNKNILRKIEKYFPPEKEAWVDTHRGKRVSTHVFLEWGEKFLWPDSEGCDRREKSDQYTSEIGEDKCHALLTQIGILVDGTVVPCCLDRNGSIALGNIFSDSLDNILASTRATRMREAMEHHRFVEPLCYSCGFKRN